MAVSAIAYNSTLIDVRTGQFLLWMDEPASFGGEND